MLNTAINIELLPVLCASQKLRNRAFIMFRNENRIYLYTLQIGIRLGNNMTIGAFKIDHPNFIVLSFADQIKQILSSPRRAMTVLFMQIRWSKVDRKPH